MQKDTPCIVAERIKARRTKLSMTQEQLAESSGLSRRTIGEHEKMTYLKLSGDSFMKLCSALDCSADYLLGIDDFPNHEATDIHRVTGLSEDAIIRLKEWNDNNDRRKRWGEYISKIITDDEFEMLMSHISYLHGDYKILAKQIEAGADTSDLSDTEMHIASELYYISHIFSDIIEGGAQEDEKR